MGYIVGQNRGQVTAFPETILEYIWVVIVIFSL
jgi:hypothetical protein